jgi:hypothetical protein
MIILGTSPHSPPVPGLRVRAAIAGVVVKLGLAGVVVKLVLAGVVVKLGLAGVVVSLSWSASVLALAGVVVKLALASAVVSLALADVVVSLGPSGCRGQSWPQARVCGQPRLPGQGIRPCPASRGRVSWSACRGQSAPPPGTGYTTRTGRGGGVTRTGPPHCVLKRYDAMAARRGQSRHIAC